MEPRIGSGVLVVKRADAVSYLTERNDAELGSLQASLSGLARQGLASFVELLALDEANDQSRDLR